MAPLAASSPTNSSPLSAMLERDWSSTGAQPYSPDCLDGSTNSDSSPAARRTDRPVSADTSEPEPDSSFSQQMSSLQIEEDSGPDIILVSERYL